MDQEIFHLLHEVNRAIIKFRGTYSLWSGAHGISYNEMLVLYAIREHGFCPVISCPARKMLPSVGE